MPSPTAAPRVSRFRLLPRGAAAIVLAALSTACAQQSRAPGYYNPPPESSITDAQSQYQDSRGRSLVRAPSQLQLELDRNPPPAALAAAPAEPSGPPSGGAPADARAEPAGEPAPINPMAARVIPAPRTFMGTVPCFTPELACTAQRVTLTLSPNGRWRARATPLDGAGQAARQPVAEQGCWRGIPERPARVILQEADGTVRAEFVMPASNQLRVRSVGGQAPTLDYNLGRQPDLDGIDELGAAPAPACD
ncbi:hypothetical protein V8Z80_03635 [Orrella sp. JC864]|uniref:hypothetical protein n=1 Tax=Orrella sp. JC864 TaxID=3120298 RepID=UPI00300A6288